LQPIRHRVRTRRGRRPVGDGDLDSRGARHEVLRFGVGAPAIRTTSTTSRPSTVRAPGPPPALRDLRRHRSQSDQDATVVIRTSAGTAAGPGSASAAGDSARNATVQARQHRARRRAPACRRRTFDARPHSRLTAINQPAERRVKTCRDRLQHRQRRQVGACHSCAPRGPWARSTRRRARRKATQECGTPFAPCPCLI
jgi:hypothetical protein